MIQNVRSQPSKYRIKCMLSRHECEDLIYTLYAPLLGYTRAPKGQEVDNLPRNRSNVQTRAVVKRHDQHRTCFQSFVQSFHPPALTSSADCPRKPHALHL